MSPQQQQQILAQAQGTGNLPNYGDLDPQRFRGLTRANLAGKEGQQGLNDGSVTSVGSPMQSNSPNVRLDQSEHLMKVRFYDPVSYFCICYIYSFLIIMPL